MPEESRDPREASESDESSRASSGAPAGGEEEPFNAVPDSLEEALADAPPRVQREVRRVVSMRSLSISGQMPNPLLYKFNEEHLHKVLDHREAENQRNAQQSYSQRKYALVFSLVVFLTIVGVLLFLVAEDETSLAGQVLAGLAIFGGGFGSGFGVGRRVR